MNKTLSKQLCELVGLNYTKNDYINDCDLKLTCLNFNYPLNTYHLLNVLTKFFKENSNTTELKESIRNYRD